MGQKRDFARFWTAPMIALISVFMIITSPSTSQGKDGEPILQLHRPSGWRVVEPDGSDKAAQNLQLIPGENITHLKDVRLIFKRFPLSHTKNDSTENAVRAWIDRDFKHLKSHLPTLTETTRYTLIMQDNQPATITQLHGGNAQIYEAIAHRPSPDGRFLFVMILTSRQEESFIRALPYFRRIVSLSSITQGAKQNGRSENPYDDLKNTVAQRTQEQIILQNRQDDGANEGRGKPFKLPPGFETGMHHGAAVEYANNAPPATLSTPALSLPHRPEPIDSAPQKTQDNTQNPTTLALRQTAPIDQSPMAATDSLPLSQRQITPQRKDKKAFKKEKKNKKTDKTKKEKKNKKPTKKKKIRKNKKRKTNKKRSNSAIDFSFASA